MSGINSGICRLVAALNNAGFTTCDSGDGETHDYSCDRDYGYVVVAVEPPQALIQAADRLAATLRSLGIVPVAQGTGIPYERQCYMQAMYCPVDGHALIDVSYVHDRMLFDATEVSDG